jgi:hypothetical protein
VTAPPSEGRAGSSRERKHSPHSSITQANNEDDTTRTESVEQGAGKKTSQHGGSQRNTAVGKLVCAALRRTVPSVGGVKNSVNFWHNASDMNNAGTDRQTPEAAKNNGADDSRAHTSFDASAALSFP